MAHKNSQYCLNVARAQCRNASLGIDCRRKKTPLFMQDPPRMYLPVWQTSKMESVIKTTLTSFCWKLHFRCLISFLICLKCSIYLNMLKVLLHNFCIFLCVMVTHKQKYTTQFFWFTGLIRKVLRACLWYNEKRAKKSN